MHACSAFIIIIRWFEFEVFPTPYKQSNGIFFTICTNENLPSILHKKHAYLVYIYKYFHVTCIHGIHACGPYVTLVSFAYYVILLK